MINDYRYFSGQFCVELTKITLHGTDVRDFLQKQSTLDLNLIENKSFQLISFLDRSGRVDFYGWLTFQDFTYSILVPNILVQRSIERLNQFLISEDVQISDPRLVKINIILGPEAVREESYLKGILFEELAFMTEAKVADVPVIPIGDVSLWQDLTGWPSFDGSDFKIEILNNLRLFDLAFSSNKGCYPGQETVSKIANGRGAALAPVLLEMSASCSSGDIFLFEKKIGRIDKSFNWDSKFYAAAHLLRDFRVPGMQLDFEVKQNKYRAIVRSYPLINGAPQAKALELFYQASDFFKFDDLGKAEESFRLCIKIDPKFADAYESLGVMLGRQERFIEAIELMKKLSEVDSNSVLAHTNMSLYLMRIGKINEAEEQKSIATLKSFQSFGIEAKKKEAETARKDELKSEWAQREFMFKQVLEIDAEDTLANFGLGSLALEKGEWETAKSHLERVLSQDPKYSVAYLGLGKALKALGEFKKAKEIWNTGIKIAASKGDLMPASQMQQELNSF